MVDQRLGDAGAGIAPIPFVRSKLSPPELLPDTLPRPRLLERLDICLRRRLTLLSAPAGYGKTTLLAGWLAAIAERQQAQGKRQSAPADADLLPLPFELMPTPPKVAWLTLDAADNDPQVFQGYLAAALAQLQPGGRARAAAGAAQPTEALLAELLNDLAELAEDSVIVLDDYHLIVAPEFHRLVAFVVEHLPPRAHLLIATRADPPLPLARLRARGHLAELRAPELRFSAEEAAAYLLETMGLALTRGQVAALIERTEGWPAGLQLTATALRDRADQAAFVDSVVGSNRYIVDYLIEDVFDRLAPHVQAFLLQTSLLERLCGPLCDAVLGASGQDEAQRARELHPPTGGMSDSALPTLHAVADDSYSRLILDQLERDNLFLLPLDADRQWYRYHHLFAEVLRDRLLSGVAPERVALLHRRASAWYAAYGMLPMAVQHALEAGAIDDVVAIIEPVGLAMATRVGEATLRGWLPAIPEATVRTRPRLALLRAWLCLADYDAEGADEWLQLAQHALDRVAVGLADGIGNVANLRGEICAVRARLATLRGDAPAVIGSAAEAMALLQSDNLALRTRVAKDLGYAYMVRGELGSAEQAFAEAIENGFVAGYPYISFMAASDTAYVRTLRGQLSAALGGLRELLTHAARRGQLDAPGAGLPYLALADICRERHEFAGTLPALAEAGARITPSNTTSYLCLMLVEARVARAQGDLTSALVSARRARFIAQQRRLVWATTVLDALEAQILIARGDLDGAATLVERSQPAQQPAEFRFFPPAVLYAAEHCAIAPWQLRLARAVASPEQLAPLAQELALAARGADGGGNTWTPVKLRLLHALALAADGHEPEAATALHQALTLAAPDSMVCVFVEEGQALAPLLAPLAAGTDEAAAHARQLLAVLAQANPLAATAPTSLEPQRPAPSESAALPEPLSSRELDVLRLMADGQSNNEIAATLVIAVSTVKSHVNSIFGKLGVATRTQSIARARRLGLI